MSAPKEETTSPDFWEMPVPKIVENHDKMREVIENLLDPEMPLYQRERDEIAEALNYLMNGLNAAYDQADAAVEYEDMITEFWGWSLEYGFLMKNMVGANAEAPLPKWLWDEVKDFEPSLFTNPTVTVRFGPDVNWNDTDKQICSTASVPCAFGSVFLENGKPGRELGFEYKTREDAESDLKKLQDAGFTAEIKYAGKENT